MYPLNQKSTKPGFSPKIKEELKREDRQGKSYLLSALLVLLVVALIFFLVAIFKSSGKKSIQTTGQTPAESQSTTPYSEGTTSTTGETATQGLTGEGQTYAVQSGDTLSSIGAKFKVSWQKIAEVNNISAPYSLTVGKKLIIPSQESSSGTNTATE